MKKSLVSLLSCGMLAMSSTGLSASMDSVLSEEAPQSVVADGRFVAVKNKNSADQTAQFVLEDSAGNQRDVTMSCFQALTFYESDIDVFRRTRLLSRGGLLHTTRVERYMLRSPNTGDIFTYDISGGDNILIPRNSDQYGLKRFLDRVFSRRISDTPFDESDESFTDESSTNVREADPSEVVFEVSPILDLYQFDLSTLYEELVRSENVNNNSSPRSDEGVSGNVDDDGSSESSESDLEDVTEDTAHNVTEDTAHNVTEDTAHNVTEDTQHNVTEDIAYNDAYLTLAKNVIIIGGTHPNEDDFEDIIAGEEDSDRLRSIMRNHVEQKNRPTYNKLHQLSFGIAYTPNDEDGEYPFPALDDNILVACKILKVTGNGYYVAANADYIDFGVYEMSRQKYEDLCRVRERNGQGSEAIPVVLFNDDGSSFTIVDASELDVTPTGRVNHYSLRNHTTSV